MRRKQSRVRGWPASTPGAVTARHRTDIAPTSLRARLVSLSLRPTTPPCWLGVAVAAAFIAAESVLVYWLKQLSPGDAFGVVYLLGVLVVSTIWGLGVAVATSLASAIAFDYFRNWPNAFVPDADDLAAGLTLRTAESALPPELSALQPSCRRWWRDWSTSRRICARSRAEFTRRSCPQVDSAPRSKHWRAAHPSRSNWIWT